MAGYTEDGRGRGLPEPSRSNYRVPGSGPRFQRGPVSRRGTRLPDNGGTSPDREAAGPVGLQQLADGVAARENEKTVDQLTSKEQKRVDVSLYRTHVPAMTDAGVVDYDPDSGVIVPTERISRLEHHLSPDRYTTESRPQFLQYETPEESEVWWRLTNAGLAFVGVVALLGVALTLSPLDPTARAVTVGLVGGGAGTLALVVRVGASPGKLQSSQGRSVWVLDDVERTSDGQYHRRIPGSTDGEDPATVRFPSPGRGSEIRSSDRDEG